MPLKHVPRTLQRYYSPFVFLSKRARSVTMQLNGLMFYFVLHFYYVDDFFFFFFFFYEFNSPLRFIYSLVMLSLDKRYCYRFFVLSFIQIIL